MNLVDFNAYKYVYNENIPIYKLQKQHYWFDMNNAISSYNGKYNIYEKVNTEIEIKL